MAGSASQMHYMGGYNMVSSNVDDLLAPSTVSMIILFGSVIFATAAMATRELLRGDKRGTSAYLAGIIVLLFCLLSPSVNQFLLLLHNPPSPLLHSH